MSKEELTVKPIWFLTFLIFAAALTACAEQIPVGTAAPGAPDVPLATPLAAPPTATPHAIEPVVKPVAASASNDRGAQAWAGQNCNLCHGDQAAGRIGPQLAKTSVSADAFAKVVRGGRGSMPAYTADKLSDADLTAMLAWLQTLKD